METARTFSVEEVLKDGSVVTIRAVRPDDRARLATAFAGLDRESVYRRFFTPKRELSSSELAHLDAMDFVHEVMLVAVVPGAGDEMIVASGRYIATAPEGQARAAEIAFTVEEEYQGRGLAGRLLRHLANIARANGIGRFDAEVLRENAGMLKVFAKSGLPMQRRTADGQVHVSLELT